METELERLMVRLMGDSSNYEAMLRNAQVTTIQATGNIERITGNVTSAFSGMVAKAGATIAAVAASAGIAFSAFKGVQLFARQESMETAFETLVGSAEKARQTIADLRQFAAETPFEMPEILAASKQMIAFGEEAKNIVPTMRMLGDVSAGLSIPLGQLIYLFGTLKSQGRAFMVDLNQFAMRGIPIWKELEKVMGKSTSEIRLLVEKGQVGFPEVEKAFKSMTSEGGKFFGMTQKQSQTLEGLFSTMKDDFGAALTVIGKFIAQWLNLKGIMRGVSSAFQTVGAAFENLSKMADQAWAWLEPTRNEINEIVAALQEFASPVWEIVKTQATTAWNTFTRVAGTAMENVQKLVIEGLNVAQFAILNFQDVSALAWAKFNLGVVRAGDTVRHIFSTVIPSVLTYFSENWMDVLTKTFFNTMELFKNLFDNIARIVRNLPDALRGQGKQWEELWLPLTKGFEFAAKQLVIPERVKGQLEQQLEDEVRKAGGKLEGAWDEFQKFQEAAGMGPAKGLMSQPEQNAIDDAAKAGAAIGKAATKGFNHEAQKADAALFGSAEAVGRILSFRERVGRGILPSGSDPTQFRQATRAAGMTRASELVGPPSELSRQHIELLKQIRDRLTEQARKPDIIFENAGL